MKILKNIDLIFWKTQTTSFLKFEACKKDVFGALDDLVWNNDSYFGILITIKMKKIRYDIYVVKILLKLESCPLTQSKWASFERNVCKLIIGFEFWGGDVSILPNVSTQTSSREHFDDHAIIVHLGSRRKCEIHDTFE